MVNCGALTRSSAEPIYSAREVLLEVPREKTANVPEHHLENESYPTEEIPPIAGRFRLRIKLIHSMLSCFVRISHPG